jgi:hypothetical protein
MIMPLEEKNIYTCIEGLLHVFLFLKQLNGIINLAIQKNKGYL